jgi:Flp pilus assembly pilin Flp
MALTPTTLVHRAALAARTVVRDERGAATTEYAVVVGVCALVISGALVALAPSLLSSYEAARTVLIAPVP